MGEAKDADLPRLEAELLARDAEWADLALQGDDLDRIVSYWTDDARVYAPGWPPLIGHDAIRQFVRTMLADPVRRFTWRSDVVQVAGDGRMAWAQGPNFVFAVDQHGKALLEEGRGVTVWRRDADDVWRCVVDIWNAEQL